MELETWEPLSSVDMKLLLSCFPNHVCSANWLHLNYCKAMAASGLPRANTELGACVCVCVCCSCIAACSIANGKGWRFLYMYQLSLLSSCAGGLLGTLVGSAGTPVQPFFFTKGIFNSWVCSGSSSFPHCMPHGLYLSVDPLDYQAL